MPVHPLHSGFWSNRDWAEFGRVAEALDTSGLEIAFASGLSDEGDPWASFIAPETGETLLHFSREGQRFVVDSPVAGAENEGLSLHVLVNQVLNALQAAHNVITGNSDEGEAWSSLVYAPAPDFALHMALLDGKNVAYDAHGRPLDEGLGASFPLRGKPGSAGDGATTRGEDGLFGHAAMAVPGLALLDPADSQIIPDDMALDAGAEIVPQSALDENAAGDDAPRETPQDALIDPFPLDPGDASLFPTDSLAAVCGLAGDEATGAGAVSEVAASLTRTGATPNLTGNIRGGGAAGDGVAGSGPILSTDTVTTLNAVNSSGDNRLVDAGRGAEDRALGFRVSGGGNSPAATSADDGDVDAEAAHNAALSTSRMRLSDVSADSPTGTVIAAGSVRGDTLDASLGGGQVFAGDGNDIILGGQASPFYNSSEIVPTSRQEDGRDHDLNIDGGSGNDTVVLASPDELWAFIKLVLAQNSDFDAIRAQLESVGGIINPALGESVAARGEEVVRLVGVRSTSTTDSTEP